MSAEHLQIHTPTIEVVHQNSPEEVALSKLQDINQHGFGYSRVKDQERLPIALSLGLLGFDPKYLELIDRSIIEEMSADEKARYDEWYWQGERYHIKDIDAFNLNKNGEIKGKIEQLWPKYARQKKYFDSGPNKPPVNIFFNITGRGFEPGKATQSPCLIKNSLYVRSGDNVAILFDISSFKEDREFLESNERKRHKYGYFRANIPGNYDHISQSAKTKLEIAKGGVKPENCEFYYENGEIVMDTNWGFRLRGRVAPRKFRGILFSTERTEREGLYCEERTQKADEIARIMSEINKDRPDLMLPIYHVNGDLYWPKYIPYKQVKQTVQEAA